MEIEIKNADLLADIELKKQDMARSKVYTVVRPFIQSALAEAARAVAEEVGDLDFDLAKCPVSMTGRYGLYTIEILLADMG